MRDKSRDGANRVVVGRDGALLNTNGKIRLSPVRCQQQSEIKENSTKLNQIHHLIISEREMEANQKDKFGRADKSQELHHLGSALNITATCDFKK